MATVPANLFFTTVTAGGAHVLQDTCRKVTITAVGNDTMTISIGGDAPLLKDGTPISFEDRELGGKTLTFGGTFTAATISVVEHLGAGA